MKKILALLTLAAVVVTSAALLTGFIAKRSSGTSSDIERVDMGSIYYNGSTEGETFLTGLDGRKIKASEIDYLWEKSGWNKKDIKQTNILNEKDFKYAECDGFAYGFVPGVYFDTENDPGKFGSDGLSYIGEKTEGSPEFIRINVGDKFGDLTVKSAQCNFSSYIRNNEDYLGYSGGKLEFDGEVTLTGLLEIPSQLDAYPGLVLEMELYSGLENGLPLSLDYRYDPESGYLHYPWDWHCAYTDVPPLYLGKFPDYSIDFDGLSEGDTARVEITVTNVCLISGLENCHATAEIINVKRL